MLLGKFYLFIHFIFLRNTCFLLGYQGHCTCFDGFCDLQPCLGRYFVQTGTHTASRAKFYPRLCAIHGSLSIYLFSLTYFTYFSYLGITNLVTLCSPANVIRPKTTPKTEGSASPI